MLGELAYNRQNLIKLQQYPNIGYRIKNFNKLLEYTSYMIKKKRILVPLIFCFLFLKPALAKHPIPLQFPFVYGP